MKPNTICEALSEDTKMGYKLIRLSYCLTRFFTKVMRSKQDEFLNRPERFIDVGTE